MQMPPNLFNPSRSIHNVTAFVVSLLGGLNRLSDQCEIDYLTNYTNVTSSSCIHLRDPAIYHSHREMF